MQDGRIKYLNSVCSDLRHLDNAKQRARIVICCYISAMLNRALQLAYALALAVSPLASAQWDPSRFARYSGDAGNDFASSLPIGNGRLGAAIYGTGDEKITLNENSIWSGPWQDRANRNSKNALSGIRSQLVNGDITAAGQATLQNSTSPGWGITHSRDSADQET